MKGIITMEKNNDILKSVQEALNEIKSVADAKTIVGDPININDNVTILPISKMTVGMGIGGRNSQKEKGASGNSAGASGVSILPIAFLIINASGDVKMLNVGTNTGSGYDYDSIGLIKTVNSIDKALEKAPDIIEKLKVLVSKATEE